MSKYIVVYDFETSDKVAETCHPLQIAAVAIERKTLEIVPQEDGGLFKSYMRPPISDEEILDANVIKEDALRVNHIKREDIAGFPAEKVVWNNFSDWMKQWRASNNKWHFPIRAGYNIINFDDVITRRLNETYNTKWFFHPRDFCDLISMTWGWQESNPEVESISWDNIKKHLGMSGQDGQAHTADADCLSCARYLVRLLSYQRLHGKRQNFFKDAFADQNGIK
jgi:DNA polymerase III epsilon subunit-like protein